VSVFSSLSNRIFFATSLLAVISIGVAIYRVNDAVTAQAELELTRGLEEAGALVENYRSTLLEHLTREARLVADLPKLRAAVATDDPPTVQPIAADYRRDLRADLFVVTGRAGHVLAAVDAPPSLAERLPAGLAPALEGRESVWIWPTRQGLLEVVSVPIWEPGQPVVLGTLTVGFALDDRAASRLKALTASEIAFTFGGAVHAATLPGELWPSLAELSRDTARVARLIGDEEYVAISRPLLPQAPASDPNRSRALVLRSRSERLRVLSRVHAALAATAAVAVLAAIGLSFALARTVTRPLGVITRTMREVAASGDLTRRIPEPPATRWDDEDARLLARTYNTMTESIARFQREAAQRDRLSSLGRLSTIVAHEIRNPLMIIKAALRPLRREAVPDDPRLKAVADIEEEVARLNRIVSGVLDFARPIRFDLAPGDVNAVCRDAVQAVSAGEPHPAIDLCLDPLAGTVVTDAERLRQALINVLGNALQAADARGTTGRVRLSTARTPAGVRITIDDNGPGMPPDVAAHIFEPFFTTRPAGSGIGLAITRNIIEGLGGSIALARSGPDGSTFTIELPAAGGAAMRTARA